MKRKRPLWKKVLLGLVATLATLVAALVVTVVVLDRRRYDAPYPNITASDDPSVIARGRYLALGPAHCLDCHGNNGTLAGGHEWKLPLGKIYSKNITPDRETGIGKLTDGEIARTLRYGVGPDGHAMLPFMPFANLSDEDLTAIVSFLRSQAPIRNVVPKQAPTLLGRALMALLIRPRAPDGTPPALSPSGPTIERGKYVANHVANCLMCHTKTNELGKLIGPSFAGGNVFEEEKGTFVTPNLTPDKETGRITAWTEDAFVLRFKSGVGPEGSPMPWRSFGNISEDDARALYRYLRTLPPVHNPIDPPKKEVVAAQ